MRKFLPIFLVTLLLGYFVTWQTAFANHKCGEVCDQWTQEGACTHGCYAGGAANPDYHNPDDYKYNGPSQEEIDRQNRETAAAQAAVIAAAQADAETLRLANEKAALELKNKQDLDAQLLKAQEVKASDQAAAAAGERSTTNQEGKCDGWAEPGSEHRNAGNGCFYSCDAGNWKGPNRCDGQGNGLFQGDPGKLSPDEIANEVARRQTEAQETVLKQDGKILEKDANGEYKKDTNGNYIVIDDPNADPNRKTTTQIAEETAAQRTAEQGVQAQIAIKEYETKVAAANRETNPEIRNQMLAEFALLYQNSVPAAATNLSAIDPGVVTQVRTRLETEGGNAIGNSNGTGATAICLMFDKPGGSQLGYVPCDDTVVMSKKEVYGTLYQYQALRYGLELTVDDLGKDPTALKAKLAKASAARIDAQGQVLNSPLDFEAEAKKNSGYLAIYCGGCGGFAADPKGLGCNAEIESKKAAGTCSSDPPICKNPDGSLCAVNKDNKAQYGTKSEEGVVYSYVPSIGWQTATQIATSELSDPKKCVERLGQYACDQITSIQDTSIETVNQVFQAISSSQTIGMSNSGLTIDGIPLNDWIKSRANLPLTSNDVSTLNNQANRIATQVYSFQEVSKSSRFEDYSTCIKDNSESEKCIQIGIELFEDTNYARLTPENQRLILTNLAVNAGSQNPDRRADVFSFLGLTNTEISSANNQINQNVHLGDLANKYQSGQILTPNEISQISKYFEIDKLDENRSKNLKAASQNLVNTATLNLYNARNQNNISIDVISQRVNQALSGLDANQRQTAQANSSLLQQFMDCRPPKNCTNLFSQLQNTNLPKDILTEINKIRVGQITFENAQYKTQVTNQVTTALPANIQSAVDARYDELVRSALASKQVSYGFTIDLFDNNKLSSQDEASLKAKALADILSQNPESVTLNPSTNETGFQNYINNWKTEHPPTAAGRFGTRPASAPPSMDQLKQDAVKFAVQTCAAAANLSGCTQSLTLDKWGAAQRIFEKDPTLQNLPPGNQLYKDFLAGEINPIELEQNLINIRSDWKNVVALKVNNIFDGTTATGTLLQKEAKESGLDSYENIYKYMRGTWIAGAPIAAAAVAIAGIGLLPVVAPVIGTFTTLSTGFGIYATTQGIGSTYQACPDGAFAGTSEQRYACATTGANTIYMALSTGMGVATGAYASASKAATTLSLSKIGNTGSTLLTDVKAAFSTGTAAINTPAWIEKVGFANSIIGLGVFGTQAVVECGKGLSASCVINLGMAIGSLGHSSTFIASKFVPTSNINSAIALGQAGRVSGEISELADKLDGLNSCNPGAPGGFNIGNCISGLIDGFADGNSISIKNNMLQAPTGLVSAQQNMNDLVTKLQTSSTDALEVGDRITMTKAVIDAIDENRYIQAALGTPIPNNPTILQQLLAAQQTEYQNNPNPTSTYNLLHALYLVQQERVLLSPVRALFPSQNLTSLRQAQQELDQISHSVSPNNISSEYIPQANKVIGLLIAAQKDKFTPEQAQQVETALAKLTENLQQQATANAEAAKQTGDSSFAEASQRAEQAVSALNQSQSPTPPNFFARLRGAGLPSTKLDIGDRGELGDVVQAVRDENRDITGIQILDNKGEDLSPDTSLTVEGNDLFFKFNEVHGTRVEFRYADGTSRTFVSPKPGQAYGLTETAPRLNLLQATGNYFQNLFLQGQTGRAIENLDIRKVRNPGIAQQLAGRDDLNLSIATRQNRISEINNQIAGLYTQADTNGLLDEHSKIVSIRGPKENGVTLGRRLINQVDDLVLERTNLENELVGLGQQLKDNLNEPLVPSVPEPVAKPDTPPNFLARMIGAGLPSTKLDIGDRGELGDVVQAVRDENGDIAGIRILNNKGENLLPDTSLTVEDNSLYFKFNEVHGTRVEFRYADGTSRTFVSPKPGQAYGFVENKSGLIAPIKAYLTNLIPALDTIRIIYEKQTQIIQINKQIDKIMADAKVNNLLNENGNIVYQRGAKNGEGVTLGALLYNQLKVLTTERSSLENEIVELKKQKRIPNLQISNPILLDSLTAAISPWFPPIAHLLATNPQFISQINWYWNNRGLVADRVANFSKETANNLPCLISNYSIVSPALAAGAKAPCGSFNITSNSQNIKGLGIITRRNDGLYFGETKITTDGVLVTTSDGNQVKLYQSGPNKIRVDNQPYGGGSLNITYADIIQEFGKPKIKTSQTRPQEIFPGLESEILKLRDSLPQLPPDTKDSVTRLIDESISNFPSVLSSIQKGLHPIDYYISDFEQFHKYDIDRSGNLGKQILAALRSDLENSVQYLSDKYTFINENVSNSLLNISYFRVTSRGLDKYTKFNHVDESMIPPNKTVVDIGSGLFQEFSQGIRKARPDLKVINLDASLALPINERYYDPLAPGKNTLVYHINEGGGIIWSTEETRRLRLQRAQPNTIATILPNIPLKTNSAYLMVDSFGPATYLDPKSTLTYFQEINRVLESGGEAHIYPVDSFDEFIGSDRTKPEYLEVAKIRVTKALEEANISEYSFYEQMDAHGNNRLGLIIKKNQSSSFPALLTPIIAPIAMLQAVDPILQANWPDLPFSKAWHNVATGNWKQIWQDLTSPQSKPIPIQPLISTSNDAINVYQELYNPTKNIQTDEQQRISDLADFVYFLNSRGVISLTGNANQRQEVISTALTKRQQDAERISPLLATSLAAHDQMSEKYGGVIISDPTQIDTSSLLIIIVDSNTMQKINPDNPLAFVNTRYGVLVISQNALSSPQEIQRVLDHETSHLVYDPNYYSTLKTQAQKYFGADRYKGYRRLINEGLTELRTYYSRPSAYASKGQFFDLISPEYATSMEVFDIEIRNSLGRQGLDSTEIDRLLLSVEASGLNPLVEKLGGWDNFFKFFEPFSQEARYLDPSIKESPTLSGPGQTLRQVRFDPQSGKVYELNGTEITNLAPNVVLDDGKSPLILQNGKWQPLKEGTGGGGDGKALLQKLGLQYTDSAGVTHWRWPFTSSASSQSYQPLLSAYNSALSQLEDTPLTQNGAVITPDNPAHPAALIDAGDIEGAIHKVRGMDQTKLTSTVITLYDDLSKIFAFPNTPVIIKAVPPKYEDPPKSLPPIKDGDVRLYRGVKSRVIATEFSVGMTAEEQTRWNQLIDKIINGGTLSSEEKTFVTKNKDIVFVNGGRWYSDDYSVAKHYAKENGTVFYIDLPKSEAVNYIMPTNVVSGGFIADNFLIPSDLHRQLAQPISAQIASTPTTLSGPGQTLRQVRFDPQSGKVYELNGTEITNLAPNVVLDDGKSPLILQNGKWQPLKEGTGGGGDGKAPADPGERSFRNSLAEVPDFLSDAHHMFYRMNPKGELTLEKANQIAKSINIERSRSKTPIIIGLLQNRQSGSSLSGDDVVMLISSLYINDPQAAINDGVVDELTKIIQDPKNYNDIYSSAEALLTIGVNLETVRTILEYNLTNPNQIDPDITIACINVLSKIRNPLSIQPILSYFWQQDERIRFAAVLAIGDFRDPSVIPYLDQFVEASLASLKARQIKTEAEYTQATTQFNREMEAVLYSLSNLPGPDVIDTAKLLYQKAVLQTQSLALISSRNQSLGRDIAFEDLGIRIDNWLEFGRDLPGSLDHLIGALTAIDKAETKDNRISRLITSNHLDQNRDITLSNAAKKLLYSPSQSSTPTQPLGIVFNPFDPNLPLARAANWIGQNITIPLQIRLGVRYEDAQGDLHWKLPWQKIAGKDSLAKPFTTFIQKPIINNKINSSKLNTWINQYSGEAKEIAKILSSHIRHISFDEFQTQLTIALNDLNSQIGDQKLLVILSDNPEKSDHWVYNLVKDRLPKNHQVVLRSEVWRMTNKPKHYLLLDDALYSGNQMNSNLVGLDDGWTGSEEPLHIHVLTPFTTTHAANLLLSNSRKTLEIVLHNGAHIDTLEEIIRKNYPINSDQILSQIIRMYGRFIPGKSTNDITLTYFEHKLPDEKSFLEPLAFGRIVDIDGNESFGDWMLPKLVRFIPYTIEPYKKKALLFSSLVNRLKEEGYSDEKIEAVAPDILETYDISYETTAPVFIDFADHVLRTLIDRNDPRSKLLFIARDGLSSYLIARQLIRRFPERYPGISEDQLVYAHLNSGVIDNTDHIILHSYLAQQGISVENDNVILVDIGIFGSILNQGN